MPHGFSRGDKRSARAALGTGQMTEWIRGAVEGVGRSGRSPQATGAHETLSDPACVPVPSATSPRRPTYLTGGNAALSVSVSHWPIHEIII